MGSNGGGEAVAREAPGAQSGGERAQRLACVRWGAHPALSAAAVVDQLEHAVAQSRAASSAGHDELKAARPGSPARAHGDRRARPGAERDPAEVALAGSGTVQRDRCKAWRLARPQGRQGIDQVQRQVTEAADPARPGSRIHAHGPSNHPSIAPGWVSAAATLATRPSSPSRSTAPSLPSAGSSRRNSAATAGVRLRPISRATARASPAVRATGFSTRIGRPARGLHAQRGALIGGGADEHGVSAGDRGLGTRDRRPRDGDRDRRRIPVPHGGQAQVRLASKHAQHIRDMRVTAAQERDVDRHRVSVAPPAGASNPRAVRGRRRVTHLGGRPAREPAPANG